MNRISPVTRISICLTTLTLAVLFIAQALGMVPDPFRTTVAKRTELSEAIAIQFSLAAQRNDLATMSAVAAALVKRNVDVVSIGVRDPGGELLLDLGDHIQLGVFMKII